MQIQKKTVYLHHSERRRHKNAGKEEGRCSGLAPQGSEIGVGGSTGPQLWHGVQPHFHQVQDV